MREDFKQNIGKYLLLDTLDSRPIRTILNLETIPMPEQFAAKGHSISKNRTKFWKGLENAKKNYSNRIYIRQCNTKDNLIAALTINIIDGEVSIFGSDKYIYNKDPIEISEKLLNRSFEENLLLDNISHKGINIYRQRFLIKERKLPPEQQPLNECNRPYYDEHEIQWNIMCTRIKLLDQLSLSTISRKAAFELHFPHNHHSCIGALVKESQSNVLRSLFEIKSLTK